MNWKKELEDEVQPKELVLFIQKISSRDLEPIQFSGLLKMLCIQGWVAAETEEERGFRSPEEPESRSSEELESRSSEEFAATPPPTTPAPSELEAQSPGAKAQNGTMRAASDVTETPADDAPTSTLARKPRPRPRPYEELLSELIDRYIELKKPQRIEIMQFLDELEKENKKEQKLKKQRMARKKR